jgi:S-DNA-T family DNA segregation ATPase FtsK/SpoIIIE
MTRDQKLDVMGVLLALTGILLLLALFSPNQSIIVSTIVEYLYYLFGIGRFVVAIACLLVGAWIILRHFNENLPDLAPEQFLGAILLFVGLITSLSTFTETPVGGIVGKYFSSTIIEGLGLLGAFIVLIAWLSVGAILTLRTSTKKIVGMLENIYVDPNQILQTRKRKSVKTDAPIQNKTADATITQSGKTEASNIVQPQSNKRSQSTKLIEKPELQQLESSPILNEVNATHWHLPEITDILAIGAELAADDEYDRQRSQTIEETLLSFGAPGRVVEINRGPTITQFGVEPDFVTSRTGRRTKVKVNKISALADDLALALAAVSIRIEAPVPGKGYIGMEVPNTYSSQVALRDLMESESYQNLNSPLALCLGQDVSGKSVCADLRKMPHLLIAGTTGSGKSVCVNGIITTLLLNNTPDQLKMLMIDPKRVELTIYRHIPHLLAPVIVDVNKVVSSLQWISREMDTRYTKFADTGCRNIEDFNKKAIKIEENTLPYIVVIVDELADLMMVSAEDTEQIITRLAQMARATGIHLIISTQRPSADVVTGLIKANFPARIAFAVASLIDSRVILDHPGAERLLGRGDMLFQSPDSVQPLRMQGTFVSDAELRKLVRHWRGFNSNNNVSSIETNTKVNESETTSVQSHQSQDVTSEIETLAKEEDRDALYATAIETVQSQNRASISMLQKHLRIGYTRAAKLIDDLEDSGIVGPAKSGAKQRDVFSKSPDIQPDVEDNSTDSIEMAE